MGGTSLPHLSPSQNGGLAKAEKAQAPEDEQLRRSATVVNRNDSRLEAHYNRVNRKEYTEPYCKNEMHFEVQ